MGPGDAGGVKNFSVGICDCAPLTARSSFFLSTADFFQNQFFWIILTGIPSECQTVWINSGQMFCRA